MTFLVEVLNFIFSIEMNLLYVIYCIHVASSYDHDAKRHYHLVAVASVWHKQQWVGL